MTERSAEQSFFQMMDQSAIRWISRRKGARLAGVLVFDIRLMIRDPHRAEARARAVRAVDELRAFVPDSTYRWWWTREGTRPKRISAGLPSSATLFADAVAAEDDLNLLLLDAEDAELDASRHCLALRYRSSFMEEEHPVGSFQFSVPLPWVERREPGFMRDLFIRLTTLLEPRFGSAGLAMATPLAVSGSAITHARAEIYPFLKRFPGIDSGEAASVAEFLASEFPDPEGGLPTVNWLTYADNATLALCGGRNRVAAQFGQPDCPVFAYGAGLTVQAGPSPQLGDTDAGVPISLYARVADVLTAARLRSTDFPVNPSYGRPGSDLDHEMFLECQNEYLTRFDRMKPD